MIGQWSGLRSYQVGRDLGWPDVSPAESSADNGHRSWLDCCKRVANVQDNIRCHPGATRQHEEAR